MAIQGAACGIMFSNVAGDVQRFMSWANDGANFGISRNFWQGTNHPKQIDVILRRHHQAPAHRGRGSLPTPALAGVRPGSPHPVRPTDSAVVAGSLDHLCEKRGFRTPTIAGSMLALVVRAVLTFQHRAVRGPGAWSTFPQGPVSLRLTGTNRASLHTPAQDGRGATKPAGAVEQKKRRSQRRKQLAFVGAAIPCGVS